MNTNLIVQYGLLFKGSDLQDTGKGICPPLASGIKPVMMLNNTNKNEWNLRESKNHE